MSADSRHPPLRHRDALLEIGAAGPLAGAALSLALVLVGLSMAAAGVASNLVNAVLRGTTPAITHGKPTGAAMPGFAWKLSDAEVAAVGSFVRNSWGNAAPAVSAASVAEARKSLNAPAKLKFANAAR